MSRGLPYWFGPRLYIQFVKRETNREAEMTALHGFGQNWRGKEEEKTYEEWVWENVLAEVPELGEADIPALVEIIDLLKLEVSMLNNDMWQVMEEAGQC